MLHSLRTGLNLVKKELIPTAFIREIFIFRNTTFNNLSPTAYNLSTIYKRMLLVNVERLLAIGDKLLKVVFLKINISLMNAIGISSFLTKIQ